MRAKWHSWNATSGSAQAKVTVGAATHFTIGAASATPGAGVADNLTITALDEKNSAVTTYTGSHGLTFSGASSSPGGNVPTVANSSGTAVAFGSSTAINFTAGVATVVSSTKNGVMKLNKVETASVTATDGSISTSSGLAIAVVIGAAAKLSLTNVTVSAGSIGAGCFFTCAITGLGNSGTVKANVAVTDSVGSTIAGTPLTIPSTGVAETAAQFTYTSKSSGNFTDTITVATSEGTTYTSATATASK